MKKFFEYFYCLMERNLLITRLLLMVLVMVMAFFVTRINIVEDISHVLPKTDQTEQYNSIIESSPFFRKIIFQTSFIDTNIEDPDALIQYASTFIDSIKQHNGNDIEDIHFATDPSNISEIYGFIDQHLPIFLEESDYEKLDSSMINTSKILEKDYQLMVSPSSTVVKEFIKKDPLGWNYIALKKMQNLSINPTLVLYDNVLFSQDKKKLIFFITLKHKSSESKKNTAFVDQLNKLNKEFASIHKNIKLEYYGGCIASVDNASQIKKDSVVITIISLLLFGIFFFYYFKNIFITIYLIIPVAFGILFSLCMVSIFKENISAIALGAGSVVFGISINYSIHFFTHYKFYGSKKEAIKSMAVPLTLGGFTTLAGFFSLCFSSSPLLMDLGFFAGFALLGSALFTLTFYPFVISDMHHQWIPRSIFTKFDDIIARWIITPKRPLMILGIIIFVSLFFVNKTGFNGDMTKLNFASATVKSNEMSIHKTLDLQNKKTYHILSSGSTIDEALTHQHEISDRISSNGLLSDVIIPFELQKKRIERWNEYWSKIKNTSKETETKKAFENSNFSIDFYTNVVQKKNINYLPIPTDSFLLFSKLFGKDMMYEHDGKYFIASQLSLEKIVADSLSTSLINDNNHTLLSKSKMTNSLVESIKNDFNYILYITALIVFFGFLISYGRIELALIAFLPMMISWIIILGIMGLFHIEFNIINIILSTFIFGLGDDFSVFTLESKLEYYKSGKNNDSLNRESVFLSLIATLFSLSILAFAHHPALKSIALISTIGLISVFFVSQLLIPILFNFYIQNKAEKKLSPYTMTSFLKTFFSFIFFALGGIFLSILAYVLKYIFFFLDIKRRKYFFHVMIGKMAGLLVYINFKIKTDKIDPKNLDFSTPSIIIANHQSFLDILWTVSLDPRIILMVNKWVWNSPIFRIVVQFADYVPALDGEEVDVERVKQKIADGYSVLVFPEGTRSVDSTLKRFKKGAFFLAEHLEMDISPMIIHGAGHTLTKGEFQIKKGCFTYKFLPRILHSDRSWGDTYQDRNKSISLLFKSEFNALSLKKETHKYWSDRVELSYVYRGPMIEHYVRIKMAVEKYYEVLESYIPYNGKVTDIGCGMGYMIFLMSQSRKQVDFTGLDYDEEKIEIATHNYLRTNNINFNHSDVLKYNYTPQDVFIILDVLHYFPKDKQYSLLKTLFDNLNNGGKIILKDGLVDDTDKHKKTILSEKMASLLGFNKGEFEKFEFLHEATLTQFCKDHLMNIRKIDMSKDTSNAYFIIEKN